MHAYLLAGILAAPACIKGLAGRIVQRCGGRAGVETPALGAGTLWHPRVNTHSHTSGWGRTALHLLGNSSAIWHFQANRILLIKISYFFLSGHDAWLECMTSQCLYSFVRWIESNWNYSSRVFQPWVFLKCNYFRDSFYKVLPPSFSLSV